MRYTPGVCSVIVVESLIYSECIAVTAATLTSMKNIKMSGLTDKIFKLIQSLRVNEIQSASRFRVIMASNLCIGTNRPSILNQHDGTADTRSSLHSTVRLPGGHVCCVCSGASRIPQSNERFSNVYLLVFVGHYVQAFVTIVSINPHVYCRTWLP